MGLFFCLERGYNGDENRNNMSSHLQSEVVKPILPPHQSIISFCCYRADMRRRRRKDSREFISAHLKIALHKLFLVTMGGQFRASISFPCKWKSSLGTMKNDRRWDLIKLSPPTRLLVRQKKCQGCFGFKLCRGRNFRTPHTVWFEPQFSILIHPVLKSPLSRIHISYSAFRL